MQTPVRSIEPCAPPLRITCSSSEGEDPLIRYLAPYGAALLVLLVLDFLWLGLVMREFYRSALGPMMREQPRIVAAVLFYVLYAAGVTYFAALPAMEGGQWQRAAILGGAFGFFAYATYDITNYATLNHFPFRMVLVDVLWGMAVSAVAAVAAFFAGRLLHTTM